MGISSDPGGGTIIPNGHGARFGTCLQTSLWTMPFIRCHRFQARSYRLPAYWAPAGLGRKQLEELGTKLEQARRNAPRSPAQPSALKKTVDAVIA
jgi:hypothetical protein